MIRFFVGMLLVILLFLVLALLVAWACQCSLV